MPARINMFFTRLTDYPDTGLLLLRLTFGILMLFHGVAKIEHGVNWIISMLQDAGLPDLLPMVCILVKSWLRYLSFLGYLPDLLL